MSQKRGKREAAGKKGSNKKSRGDDNCSDKSDSCKSESASYAGGGQASSSLHYRKSSVLELLGSSLRRPDGQNVSTTEQLSGKGVLGLYFSAHWCPPCRQFTPVLSEKYLDMIADDKDVEIVFVSADKDAATFSEYHEGMTFPAVHFENEAARSNLSRRFNIASYPSLVFYDLQAKKLITSEGREAMSRDSYMEDYPFTPVPLDIKQALGSMLQKPDGTTITTENALGGKSVVALYFSAHWCPPCRGFTPRLCEFYTALKKAGKDFELVFVSSDKTENDFRGYHGSMNFLAMPFSRRAQKAALSQYFQVEGIPTLVFFDLKNNITITTSGTSSITSPNFLDEFPYHSKPVTSLSESADGIDSNVSFLLLMEDSLASVQKESIATLTELATSELAKESDMQAVSKFFYATESNQVSPQIRKGCGLGKTPAMLILDLGDRGGFYVPNRKDSGLTAMNIREFMRAFDEGELPRQQWAK